MSKVLQWIIGIGVVLVVLAMIASAVLPWVLGSAELRGGYFGRGMMGWRGHMGGFGMPFFGGMGGMFLGPLVIIGLIALGVALWVRRPAAVTPPPPPAASVNCAHCGQALQAGWKACPYCGEKV